jgi:hypothetical protein
MARLLHSGRRRAAAGVRPEGAVSRGQAVGGIQLNPRLIRTLRREERPVITLPLRYRGHREASQVVHRLFWVVGKVREESGGFPMLTP